MEGNSSTADRHIATTPRVALAPRSVSGRARGRLRALGAWLTEQIVAPVLEPIPFERHAAMRVRWITMPEPVCTDRQVLGRAMTGWGMTSSAAGGGLDHELAGLDQALRVLGPGARCRIGGRDATLLPTATVGRSLEYALSIGLEPVVQLDARRLLAQPECLERLMVGHGLREVVLHLHPEPGLRDLEDEVGGDPLLKRLAGLVRDLRQRTGRRLRVTHLVRMGTEDLADLPRTVAALMRDLDTSHTLCFEAPPASRGLDSCGPSSRPGIDEVWHRVCEGVGEPLSRRAILLGHPDCTILAAAVVLEAGARRVVLEAAESGHRWDRSFVRRVLSTAGAAWSRNHTGLARALAMVSLGLRHPLLLAETPLYLLARLWRARRELCKVLAAAVGAGRLAVRPLVLLVHRLMDPAELETSSGQERLSGCAFTVVGAGRICHPCQVSAGCPDMPTDELRAHGRTG